MRTKRKYSKKNKLNTALSAVYKLCSFSSKALFSFCRLKCGEFLLLLIGHVNVRRDQAPLASIHDDVRQLLGEKSASLIWAASQFGSTLDPEQRQTALHIQARRVLESIEMYWCKVISMRCISPLLWNDCISLSRKTWVLFMQISYAHMEQPFLHWLQALISSQASTLYAYNWVLN